MVKFQDLKGKIITKIDVSEDEILFYTENEIYKLYHTQDCCESVYIEDICGDINWLIGSPVLLSEERLCEEDKKHEYDDCFLWTFYEISTQQGAVTIRWYGTSNGYYSVSVDFELIGEKENE